MIFSHCRPCRLPLGPGIPALLLLALGVLPAGCQRSPSLERGADASLERKTASSVDPLNLQIPDETLNAHGLKTQWTSHVALGTLQSVHLLGDDLFAVALPRPGEAKLSLIAYRRQDGLQRWAKPLDFTIKHRPGLFRYPPAAAGAEPQPNELYISQRDTVICLDLRHGQSMWESRMAFPVSTGVSANETHFFVGSSNGRIYGVPKKKDIEDWFYITDYEIPAPGLVRDLHVYCSSRDGKLFRFHAARGPREHWQFATGAAIVAAPALFSQWVYVGSTDYKLYCLLARDGSKVWEHQAQAPIKDAPVVVSYRANLPIALCIADDQRPASDKRTLWALNAATGKILWSMDHVSYVVAVGRNAIYLLLDPRAKEGRTLVAVDGATGARKSALAVDRFAFIPSSAIPEEPTENQRGLIYLIDRSGFIQAIEERF